MTDISPDKAEILRLMDEIDRAYASIQKQLKWKAPIKSRMAYGCITQEVNNSLRHLHRLRHWIIYETDLESEKGGVF